MEREAMHPRVRQLLTVLALIALAGALLYLNVRIRPPAIPTSAQLEPRSSPALATDSPADAGAFVRADSAELVGSRRHLFANRSMKDELVSVARDAHELKPTLALLDNLNCERGMKERDALLQDASPRPGYAPLLEAYSKATCGDRLGAIGLLQKELLHALGASHKTLQTWHQLRQLGVNPGADVAQEVLGVVIDVSFPEGTETTALYSDGAWERISTTHDVRVRDQKSPQSKDAARHLVSEAAPLLKVARKESDVNRPVNAGFMRWTFLTPAGHWVSEIPSSDFAADRTDLAPLRAPLQEFRKFALAAD